jgi:aldehyde dehydrogenase (NAD+)
MPPATRTGRVIAEVPAGNRKDIRNAVEAARAATGWARPPRTTGRRCSIFIAENLCARPTSSCRRIAQLSGAGDAAASARNSTSASSASSPMRR